MKKRPLREGQGTYVDTPRGIFTAAGVWFHVTEAGLHRYAGDVLRHEPVPRLLALAVRWLRTPQVLTLWLLPLFLWRFPPLAAALGGLVVYVGWRVVGPGFVSWHAARLLRFFDLVLAQALYYVFMLSMLSAQGRLTAVWVGLGGFVLLRWGLVARLTAPLVRRLCASLYALPVPDQVLRALIVRAALRHRVALPEVDAIERQILDNWTKKPRRDAD